MEKFVVKKRNTAEQQSEETPAKKLKKNYDNEVETTESSSGAPSVQTSQIQKSSLLCAAPTDISTSGGDKPTQPRLKEYPKHGEGKTHARSFVGAWFDKYEWAEYSQQRDAMFCFACRHFAPAAYGKSNDAFIKSGFRRWKKAHGKDGSIARHLNSHCHKTSYIAWTDYRRNKLESTSIAQSISEAYQTKVRENRHFIKTLGEILLLTATQAIAQRGHREGDDERNPGNVRKFLQFTAKHDPIIADRVKSGPKNEKYTCSAIQNEMIEVLASMVKEEIAENVKSCYCFSIQADGAKDVSKTEQLAIIIRFFDEITQCIQECFISFHQMMQLDAAYITDTILKALQKLGLDYKSSLIGLGFDGASVMSGGISGVQKRIQEKAPFAYYVHCYGHRLNLVLISVAKYVPQASEFFILLEELYVFASNSVVHEKFLSIQQKIFPGERERELQHLSDTRWWCRATSCENALLRLECIVKLLKETSADDTGARAVSARGLLAQIDAEFVYLLHFFSEILGKINKISQQLQKQEVDLGSVTILISSLREYLADMRSSNLIEQYFTKVSELCEKCDIPSTTTRKRTRKPSRRLDDFIASETTGQRSFEGLEQSCVHHIRIFYEILDCLISELDRRFSKTSCEIFNGIAALCPGQQSFLCEKDLIQFAVAYSVNPDDLKHEIPLIKKLLTKESQQQPKTMVQFLSLLLPYKAAFDCLYKLLLIAVTLPVTSASCERSFSKMKLIKTFLRNSMNNDRLSNIALLSIESARAESINLEDFVDEFDSRHDNRRIKLH